MPHAQLDKLTSLYKKATEHDWRTVQFVASNAIAKHEVKRPQAEIDQLVKIARSILAGENGETLRLSGIDNA